MAAAPLTTKIMIIRHAEKPAASGEPFGVTAAGDQDAESLDHRGLAAGRCARAACSLPRAGRCKTRSSQRPSFSSRRNRKPAAAASGPSRRSLPWRASWRSLPRRTRRAIARQGCGRGDGLRRHGPHLLAARGHPCDRQHHSGQRHVRSPSSGRDLASTSSGSSTSTRSSNVLLLQAGAAVPARGRLSGSDRRILNIGFGLARLAAGRPGGNSTCRGCSDEAMP